MKFLKALRRSKAVKGANAAEAGPADAATEHEPTPDRGLPSVNKAPSLQGRMVGVLSVGLLALLSVGLLSWYFTHLAHSRGASTAEAQARARSHAAGESTVPPLGRVEVPVVAAAAEPVAAADQEAEEAQLDEEDDNEARPAPRAARPYLERFVPRPAYPSVPADYSPAVEPAAQPVSPVVVSASGTAYPEAAYGAGSAAPRSDFSRRLAGAVFTSEVGRSGGADTLTSLAGTEAPATGGDAAPPPATAQGDLAERLRPAVLETTRAKLMQGRRLVVPRGSSLDCTLQTAIDSTLPGLATCVLSAHVFGADGKVVLLERGTQLVGEVRSESRRGGNRLFVLWSQARTPTGVVVDLASPATDPLGRSGLEGKVDRHFAERFGAATLLSIIDGAIQAGVEASRGNGSSVVVSPTASGDIATEVLKDTVGIAPSIRVAQGARVNVLVARDLDFRSVYALELNTAR